MILALLALLALLAQTAMTDEQMQTLAHKALKLGLEDWNAGLPPNTEKDLAPRLDGNLRQAWAFCFVKIYMAGRQMAAMRAVSF